MSLLTGVKTLVRLNYNQLSSLVHFCLSCIQPRKYSSGCFLAPLNIVYSSSYYLTLPLKQYSQRKNQVLNLTHFSFNYDNTYSAILLGIWRAGQGRVVRPSEEEQVSYSPVSSEILVTSEGLKGQGAQGEDDNWIYTFFFFSLFFSSFVRSRLFVIRIRHNKPKTCLNIYIYYFIY